MVKGEDELTTLFAGARQRAITKFGKEAEDLIYIKFNKDGGAAAEIINCYGQEGIDVLKKVTIIQDAANELLKGKIAYRYIDGNSPYLNSLKSTGKIPENSTKTYFSLDKYDSQISMIVQLRHLKKCNFLTTMQLGD